MQYGVCGDPATAPIAAAAGMDFFEWGVADFLKPRETEEAFEAILAAVRGSALPCPVVRGFVPSDLKVTGPRADLVALERYVTTACRRAQAAGVETIVFGSGEARRIPEGFDRGRGWGQLVAFGRMVGPIAAACGLTVAVEPLNAAECNVLTSVAESLDYLRAVDHPAVRLLVDAYHWARGGESCEAIAANGARLAHVHVATFPGRLPPGAEPCDLQPFFDALRRGGYDGRVSIEGRVQDPRTQWPHALAEMRRCRAGAGRAGDHE